LAGRVREGARVIGGLVPERSEKPPTGRANGAGLKSSMKGRRPGWGWARISLMTMPSKAGSGSGSGNPGEPPARELKDHALGLASPRLGRTRTREGPRPSAATGQGWVSE